MLHLSPKSTCPANRTAVEVSRAFLLLLIALSTAFFLGGCAAQGGPSGGPEDKTGPLLLTTTPADGAVKVELQPQIELLFTEPIDPRSVEGSLSVYPRLREKPRILVSRRKITIKLAEPLQKNCTYVFNFGCNLRDYQNNPSPAEVKLAFAIGDSIDAGRIAGKVYDVPSNTQARVFLFPWQDDRPDSLLKQEPFFMANVGPQGQYACTNLPPGRYRALATTAKSWRALSSEDLIALPQKEPLLLTHRTAQLEDVDFRLSKLSWQPFKLLTANSVNGLVELNFSHEIDESSLSDVKVQIEPDSIPILNLWSPITNRKQILLRTMPLNPAHEYRIQVAGLLNVFNQPLVSATVAFTPKATRDTIPPIIIKTTPAHIATNVPQTANIRIDFSEPIDSIVFDRDIVWRDKDTAKVSFAPRWLNANTLQLTPQTPLLLNCTYYIQFNLRHWRDQAGNFFRDTLYTLQFTTLDISKMGTITGRVIQTRPISSKALYIEARLDNNQEVIATTQPDSLGYYRLENLPGGQYRLSIWEDRNGNGRYDYGEVQPYRPAERFQSYPTLVNVRARWETAEVNLEF